MSDAAATQTETVLAYLTGFKDHFEDKQRDLRGERGVAKEHLSQLEDALTHLGDDLYAIQRAIDAIEENA